MTLERKSSRAAFQAAACVEARRKKQKYNMKIEESSG
jgi:hypothetical protein